MFKKFLALIFLATAVQAEDLPVASIYRDFSGGLNNFYASVSLQPNESPNLLNVVIDEPMGSLTQRKGYATCGNIPSGNTATNLYEYSKNDGSRNLIVTDNISVWQTGDCVNYVLISTGLSSLYLPRFATIQDKLWIVNGSTYPITWDGTTATQLDGTGINPLAPKGKFIAYWKSRVWIGNTATSPSGLYFSALVDSFRNVLDPATSTNAWSNTANLIYFDRDNGSPLYGVKVYRDNLYAFKENNILRLVFESEYTTDGITITKSVSETGSKFQESIVEMDDGLLRFLGRDGVYAFAGAAVKRISTRWTPTFETFKQPSHAEQYKLWDTPADWLNGSLSLSTAVLSGSLALNIEDFSDNSYIDGPVWTIRGGTVAIVSGQLRAGTAVSYPQTQSSKLNGDFELDFYSGSWSTVTCAGTCINRIIITSISTSVYTSLIQLDLQQTINGNVFYIYNDNGAGGSTRICSNTSSTTLVASNTTVPVKLSISGTNIVATVNNVGILNCTLLRAPTTSALFYAQLSYNAGIDNIEFLYKSTGTFTSQISTATSLTTWKTFNTDQTLGGQSMSYAMRTGTTAYNAGINIWQTITPGAIVSTTTDIYSQWCATFTTTDNGVTPFLNNASIGWVTGDASISVITGQPYKSRYWLSASTTVGNDYNDIVMVENKTGISAITGNVTMFDLPISAMTLWNNNLYGSISNTSKIARLDYGDTDDGVAITSYWDSPDDLYGSPVAYKSINRIIADYASTPANSLLKIGLSNDLGTSWNYQTVNTAIKPLLPRNTSVINIGANRALQFRVRVLNETPGIGFKIYGLQGMGTTSSFIGN